MADMFCPQCGNKGSPKKIVKGSIVMEIILWLLLIIPGIIYSFWRLTNKVKVCAKCGNNGIIPIDSPVAQRMINSGIR